ncbi:MAG: enoyl-[acyl-carrier-protein] reductase FabK [Eubacterium sp.]|nr:enoyl-[acyl-carrier-protein] reductase FabK [Eubacterium sp.]MDD7210379.1 enoyl-[acyl-carrier-protein] reductase FabK [Lachnospiraceae bacterium]MDY5496933.1 enoyl-[acyl-carrier-protein] reductase FabK [Anaerobutyricum sp.]
MKTEITNLLGIDYPVIQGGMAWVGTAELSAAVSEAGGLGIIGSGGAPVSWVKEQIQKVKEKTDKPFGVNLMLLNPDADAIAALLVQEQVKVVTTGAGNPEKYMKAWKEAGVRVIPVVASTALAKRMEKAGADAVIAEGTESGGHIGETTTMALVPQVVDAVSIPVIAAGGIADGRGMAAAFMLGAQAVQMGTIFVAAKESIASDAYKNKIIRAKDIDTKVTGRRNGHPVRALRNQQTREYLRLEQEGASFEELEKLTLGGLRKAVVEGDVIHGSVMAGQIAGLVKDSRSCKEIVEGICKETQDIMLNRTQQFVGGGSNE